MRHVSVMRGNRERVTVSGKMNLAGARKPTRPDILDDGPANALVKQQTGYQQTSSNTTTLRFEGGSAIMEIPARHLSSRIIVSGMEQKLCFRGVH